MPDGKRSEEWKRQVGQRLRAVRTAAGYRTAREFAEKLDIEENTLTSWERGERLIEPEDLAGVRELTRVTADYIYYDDPSGLPPELVPNLETE